MDTPRTYGLKPSISRVPGRGRLSHPGRYLFAPCVCVTRSAGIRRQISIVPHQRELEDQSLSLREARPCTFPGFQPDLRTRGVSKAVDVAIESLDQAETGHTKTKTKNPKMSPRRQLGLSITFPGRRACLRDDALILAASQTSVLLFLRARSPPIFGSDSARKSRASR